MTQDPDTGRSPLWQQAYPDALKEREEALLRRRCKVKCASGKRCAKKRPDKIGLALSGGGIRSATFAFGVIQALAARKLKACKCKVFREIDFLSTVSGGGYTGSLISRLFTRDDVKGPDEVEQAIQPAQPAGGTQNTAEWIRSGAVLRWLRENGRYMAPNGSGDLLLAGAIILRNWLSIHVVLATLVLTAFVFVQLVRNGLYDWLSGKPVSAIFAWFTDMETWLNCSLSLGESYLCWSPWFLLPLLILGVAVIPSGWAYWLAADYGKKTLHRHPRALHPLCGFIFIVALIVADVSLFPAPFSLFFECLAGPLRSVCSFSMLSSLCVEDVAAPVKEAAVVVLASGVITLCILGCVRASVFYMNGIFDGSGKLKTALEWFEAALGLVVIDTLGDSGQRHRLSSCLKMALVWFGAALGLAVVDTLGQTVYVIWQNPESSLGGWLVTWLGGLAAAAAGARQIAAYFPGKAGATRIRPSLNIVAMSAAVLLVTVTLTTLNAFSHGIAWGFKGPPQVLTITLPYLNPICDATCISAFYRTCTVFLFLAVLSWFFGRTWPFLNNSSLFPFYTARLTRAYLGASNPRRIAPAPSRGGNRTDGVQDCPAPVSVTQVQADDDMSIEKCWWSKEEGKDPFAKGAPLHLVNVTINETLSGVSRVQQNDRKGVGMAIGPAGISAGVRHHVVFQDQQSEKEQSAGKGTVKQILGRLTSIFYSLLSGSAPTKEQSAGRGERRAKVFPQKQLLDESSNTFCRPFRMFAYKKRCEGDEQEVWYTGRSLSLGQWTGISGAAFSTGLGSRTSLGLSLIAGFFNVRLGLWWDSGVEPTNRCGTATKGSRQSERFFSWLLPVQSFLVDEFLSRFPGVARRWWYLSDGGHFENTGAYELIRRRLPLIVIVDAGADPDYTYDDLANLIRKARLDFGAEIEFLDDNALRWMRWNIGNLGFLAHFGSLEALRCGPSRAALAWVRYVDEPDRKSLIVYLKPTLVGDEPPDITSYYATHPNFPHQTTADQFFDEAQWESYRKLGHFITERVFADGFEPYFRLLASRSSVPRG